VTETEAFPILCRWLAETQEDLKAAHQRIRDLEERVQVADDMRWWMDRHTPVEVREMAGALEAVAW
jgi:2-methylcitrate dehydratase PrpD